MSEFKGKKFKPVKGPTFTKITAGKYRFYETRYRGKFDREEIEKFTNRLTRNLKRNNPNSGHFQVATLFGENMYRSGRMTKPGEPVSIFLEYDDMDLGPISGFNIMMSLAE